MAKITPKQSRIIINAHKNAIAENRTIETYPIYGNIRSLKALEKKGFVFNNRGIFTVTAEGVTAAKA